MSYRGILGVVAIVVVGVLSNMALPYLTRTAYHADSIRAGPLPGLSLQETEADIPKDTRKEQTHVPLPDSVRAVYMTSCVAGTPTFRDSLSSLIDATELNAVVIDIKDFSGTLSFMPKNEALMPAWNAARCGARDMESFIETLHKKGIFVIGRITVFQDPFYVARHPELAVKRSDGTVWKDYKGLSFIDVGAESYWDYIAALATDAYDIGFDELNFDYVRCPSDGNMRDIAFTHSGGRSKEENLELFFVYLHEALSDASRYESVRHKNTGRESPMPYLSVDLFGLTTSGVDDLGIGQVQERAAPYFDFIAPMVYPSHYPNGFMDLDNPNHHPYTVVRHVLTEGVRRLTEETTPIEGLTHARIDGSTPAMYQKPVHAVEKLRPWLQDFDYGGEYGVAEVRAQIQAAYDAGLTSWVVWDPKNLYTRDAYLPE